MDTNHERLRTSNATKRIVDASYDKTDVKQMTKMHKSILPVIALILLVLTSCEDRRFKTFTANVPVYLTYQELRGDLKIETSRVLEKPGKIYFKDQTMYINEYQEGIHIIDISDPADPTSISFINIPGNVDMAIKDSLLYADSYVDLVVIDISIPDQPVEVKRVEDLFEYIIPPYDYNYPLDDIDEEKGIIMAWEIKEITREIETNPYPWPVFWEYDKLAISSRPMNGGSGGGSTYGIGGSMARFLTYDNYLYMLESSYNLKVVKINDLDNLTVTNEQHLWGNIETMFIDDHYMYVGTSNGMHILKLDEPSVPVYLSTYQHITSCDPVVVNGDRAYVTLRAGNFCGGNQNLLEVINISNKYEPKRMASYAMTEPYGLGINGTTLFICEGDYGLKVYDAADPYNIDDHLLYSFSSIKATDVIPLADFLFVIGEGGFYIYDYSDLENITLMGSIPVAED